MNIIKGKITRPQRVVIYGVESVGKTTFAAQFPKPLFLDIEGGTAHLDTDRVAVESWQELLTSLTAAIKTEYGTVVLDSVDWAERLCVEDLLAQHKKQSVEDFGYGKGWVMVAERMSRFLTACDKVIEAGKNVVILAHSKVQRVEPPDLMTAYDRYELKLSKQSSPLVKEWADELWFFRFKTKVIETNGKAKGTGGKQRIILTTHSAAYDAKTRSGLAEELPMEWGSVAHLFAAAKVESKVPKGEAERWEKELEANEGTVNRFLLGRGVIQSEQTWRDCAPDYLAKVAARIDHFIQVARDAEKQMEVAA
jgi:hypothetical protein